ncbi:zinc dependent phospholipase C family protein [Fusibacter sp. JL216-2]|uniref:zinc dependent phospholipase C family protein n=1 Tax=Fusibacter sp. JL216-2 TaxID=3071453 RepID=UPI003D3376C5
MPDILTHVYCADFTKKHFEDSIVMRQIIDKHISAFYLGAQGPDFFFYYRIWPWKNNASIPKMADRIHKSKTDDFLLEAIDTIIKTDLGSKAGQMILAYWMGFLCHYALDTTAHPFIYYHSGINKDNDSKAKGDHNNHKFLENIIDTIMSKKYENIMGLPRNQADCLPKDADTLMPVYESISDVIQNVYQEDVSADIIRDAVADMRRLIVIMNDPKHRLRWWFNKAESLISKPKYITTAAFPAGSNLHYDFMNMNHNTWVHPCDKSIEYKESFQDLFDTSIERAVELLEFAWDTIRGDQTKEEFKSLVGGLSYDTGLPCTDPRKLRYSDSIFTKYDIKAYK